MSDLESPPPRTFGFLLAALGVLLTGGGLYLVALGAQVASSAYFAVAGLGVFFAGILIARGRLLGAWLYAATFLLMVTWSVFEVGSNVQELLPRLVLPGLICTYIFFGKVRTQLA